MVFGRFENVRTAVAGCPELEVLNSPESPGGHVWVHCDVSNSCADFFQTVNLSGVDGTSYGATNKGKLNHLNNSMDSVDEGEVEQGAGRG